MWSSFNYIVTVRNSAEPYKFYTFATRVREREDLLSVITIPEDSTLHRIVPIKSAADAHSLAERINRNAKALGCALYPNS